MFDASVSVCCIFVAPVIFPWLWWQSTCGYCGVSNFSITIPKLDKLMLNEFCFSESLCFSSTHIGRTSTKTRHYMKSLWLTWALPPQWNHWHHCPRSQKPSSHPEAPSWWGHIFGKTSLRRRSQELEEKSGSHTVSVSHIFMSHAFLTKVHLK